MMKNILTSLTIMLLSLNINGQGLHFDWAIDMGGANSSAWGSAVIDDTNGNIYKVGAFMDTIDFDPGISVYNLTTQPNKREAYISKYSNSGEFLWAKQLTSFAEYGWAADISIDNFGNIYSTGYFYGNADFDTGPSSNYINSGSNLDLFITKLDSNGVYQWTKTFESSPNINLCYSSMPDMVIDFQNNIWVTAAFSGTVDFDPGPGVFNLSGSFDIVIIKLDVAGSFITAMSLGSSDFDDVTSTHIDNENNFYLSGLVNGTVDFDPGLSIHNVTCQGSFILKLSNTGVFQWVKTFPNASISDLVSDDNAFIYSTGNYYDTVDFDPGPGSHILSPSFFEDAFILKLSSQGNFIWVRNYNSPFEGFNESIAINSLGHIITVGQKLGPVDFDPGVNIIDLGSLEYIWILDSIGDFVNCKPIPGVMGSNSIYVNENDDLFITGSYNGTRDFNPDMGTYFLTSPDCSAYLLKLNSCSATYGFHSVSTCDSYITQSGNITYTNPGTYVDIIDNSFGCDSIIIFDLSFYPCSTLTIDTFSCEPITSPSGNYIWYESGNYVDTITNYLGGDSIIMINLLGSTSNEFSVSACEFYESPSGNYIWTTSGTYYDTIPNYLGCDHSLTINLTINEPSYSNMNYESCDGFYLGGTQWIGSSGIYNYTITNYLGCDSIVTIDFTLIDLPVIELTEQACNEFNFNGNILTQSGIYSDTVYSMSICDTIYILDLNIISIDTTLSISSNVITSNASGENFQWINCDSSYVELPGESFQSFIPLDEGYYAVIIEESGCIDTSSCASILEVGLNDLGSTNISIYPNPASSIITIDGLIEPKNVKIYNSIGEQISTLSFHKYTNGVYAKIDHLTEGVFLIRINVNLKVISLRFVKI